MCGVKYWRCYEDELLCLCLLYEVILSNKVQFGIILQFICNVSDIVHHYSLLHFCKCHAICVRAELGVVVTRIFHRHHRPRHLICWPCLLKVSVLWETPCVPWRNIKHMISINVRGQSRINIVILKSSKTSSHQFSKKLKSRSR